MTSLHLNAKEVENAEFQIDPLVSINFLIHVFVAKYPCV